MSQAPVARGKRWWSEYIKVKPQMTEELWNTKFLSSCGLKKQKNDYWNHKSFWHDQVVEAHQWIWSLTSCLGNNIQKLLYINIQARLTKSREIRIESVNTITFYKAKQIFTKKRNTHKPHVSHYSMRLKTE